MAMNPREVWAWVWLHRQGLLTVTGVFGSAGAAAIGIVFTMWLTVRDHGDVLTQIQAQQLAQIRSLADARSEVIAEQRRAADKLDLWQTASLQRDLDMTIQLGRIDRALGMLQGKMDRAAAYQGWRVTPRVEGRQFDGSTN